MRTTGSLLAFFIFIATQVRSQELICPQPDGNWAAEVQRDIEFLSSDELGGRPPGTPFEKKAAVYIVSQFKRTRVIPVDPEYGWYQFFPVTVAASILEGTTLQVKGTTYEQGVDFFPVKYTSNGKAAAKTIYVGYGIVAPDLEYDDYAKISEKKRNGAIFVMDVGAPDGVHPHSKYIKYHNLNNRIEQAKEMGAAAVLLVNLSGMANDAEQGITYLQSKGLPVLFVKNEDLAKKLVKKSLKVEMGAEVKENEVMATNVVGLIDNEAPFTIVIGAHFDHLGMGGDNSLYKGEPTIHNGADDNASGTAGLIQLARFFSQDTLKKFNYLFIAFSAEEKGLLGSQYWTNHPTYPLDRIAYMLNMDMIGRFRDGQLAVSGTGTASTFNEFFERKTCEAFKVKTSESGVGPSDHTSFYKVNIPVLHFFTGTHEDYHKPTDDAEKINSKGVSQILRYMIDLVAYLPAEKPEFIPTKEKDSQKAPRFSVTLGVVPDYMFEGEGMRIDGITEGKPASNAGLQKGDVVIRLGEIPVTDMMSYMTALSAFKKGDETTVTFLRGTEEQTVKIQF
ncbi:MAG: M28 family peptidase [Bacteroidota bacterium]|nr:M28 family peptidase [Bacteroidota bacterium]MDX5426831.1 M28 family peptidase [Bacteroidota bacterium]MDX5504817.1 M28 family peptidase [Bacteroidota bacterium]